MLGCQQWSGEPQAERGSRCWKSAAGVVECGRWSKWNWTKAARRTLTPFCGNGLSSGPTEDLSSWWSSDRSSPSSQRQQLLALLQAHNGCQVCQLPCNCMGLQNASLIVGNFVTRRRRRRRSCWQRFCSRRRATLVTVSEDPCTVWPHSQSLQMPRTNEHTHTQLFEIMIKKLSTAINQSREFVERLTRKMNGGALQ